MIADRFCTLPRGERICYRLTGEPGAEPLLLIAGLGQQLHAWPDELTRQLAARGHYVIRFDNRDVGRSFRAATPAPTPLQTLTRRWPAGQYTLADMAADAAGLLEALAIDSAHVVGISMGGMIAQTLAARHPRRVRTLTSIMSTTGAPHVGRPAWSTWLRMATPPARDRERWASQMVGLLRHIGSHGFAFDEQQVRALALESWDRGGGAAARAGVARQLAAIFKSGDRTREVARIEAPTLVIHGDRDRMVHPSGARATVSAIPGARLHTIVGMGHDLPVGAWPQIVDLLAHHTGAATRSQAPLAGAAGRQAGGG